MKKLLAMMLISLPMSQFGLVAAVPESVKSIDLGLPSGTMWANMNIGASSMIEYGGYYAWGETSPKSNLFFSEDNYKYFHTEDVSYTNEEGFVESVTYKGYTKYVPSIVSETDGFRGFYDDKSDLDNDDDVACVEWGDEWEMPSVLQCEELSQFCIWEKVKMNGVSGYKIVGPNKNYIFLPCGGFCSTSWIQNKIEEYACYWNSSAMHYSVESYSMDWTGSPYNGVAQRRYIGRLIRPVLKSKSSSINQVPNDSRVTTCQYFNIYGQSVELESSKGQIIIKKEGNKVTKFINR